MARVSGTIDTARRRDLQREQTRARVLDSAEAHFAARGFDGASVSAIAREAGAPVPLIIYHFATKDGLWRAAVSRVHERVQARLAAELAALDGLTGRAFYKGAIKAHLRTLAAEPVYMRLVFQEAMQDSERLDWLVETWQGPMSRDIADLVAAAQDEGVMGPGDPMHLKFVLSGALTLPMTLAPEYRRMTGRDPLGEAEMEAHIETCLALLFTPGP
ncbi:TetR/AcrR family transcriptional regulator [Alkalicaulis satelles]|nr:TetR/AcrR family transcriptional regulator [Alkalicaulis satelles]